MLWAGRSRSAIGSLRNSTGSCSFVCGLSWSRGVSCSGRRPALTGRRRRQGLFEAARRLEALVDELDRMGVPPREAADLLLSIRRGVLLYAAGFEKGGRGRQADDADLIQEAKAETLEAAAELNSYFGLQLCG